MTETGHMTAHLAKDSGANVVGVKNQKSGGQDQILQERGHWWLEPLNELRVL